MFSLQCLEAATYKFAKLLEFLTGQLFFSFFCFFISALLAGELPGMQRLRLRLIFEGQYLQNLLEKRRQEVTQNVRAKAECRSAYRVPQTFCQRCR